MVEPHDEELHARVRQLEERLERLLNPGAGRFEAALDTVYQATTHGYVAVYFVGGRTARMHLLVGTESPPTTSVGYANSGSEINSYMGTVVRPGEYWMAATHKPGMTAGFECIFTPLF
jgi:hypothetical protein